MVEDIRTQWFRFFRQTATIRKFSRRSITEMSIFHFCNVFWSRRVSRARGHISTGSRCAEITRGNEREKRGLRRQAEEQEKCVESIYVPADPRHILSKLGEDVLSRRTRFHEPTTVTNGRSVSCGRFSFSSFNLSESCIWHIWYDRSKYDLFRSQYRSH